MRIIEANLSFGPPRCSTFEECLRRFERLLKSGASNPTLEEYIRHPFTPDPQASVSFHALVRYVERVYMGLKSTPDIKKNEDLAIRWLREGTNNPVKVAEAIRKLIASMSPVELEPESLVRMIRNFNKSRPMLLLGDDQWLIILTEDISGSGDQIVTSFWRRDYLGLYGLTEATSAPVSQAETPEESAESIDPNAIPDPVIDTEGLPPRKASATRTPPPKNTLFYASPNRRLEHAWAFHFDHAEGNMWIAFPTHGGFQKRIPVKDVILVGPEAEAYAKSESAKPLLKGRFGIGLSDGLDIPEEGLKPGDEVPVINPQEFIFEGYYDPTESWNGWKVPYMTREEAERFAKLEVQNGGSYTWKGDTLLVTSGGYDEPNTAESRILNTIDGPRQLWDMGMGYCWEMADDPEEEETPEVSPADQALDDFNAGKITREQLRRVMKEVSAQTHKPIDEEIVRQSVLRNLKESASLVGLHLPQIDDTINVQIVYGQADIDIVIEIGRLLPIFARSPASKALVLETIGMAAAKVKNDLKQIVDQPVNVRILPRNTTPPARVKTPEYKDISLYVKGDDVKTTDFMFAKLQASQVPRMTMDGVGPATFYKRISELDRLRHQVHNGEILVAADAKTVSDHRDPRSGMNTAFVMATNPIPPNKVLVVTIEGKVVCRLSEATDDDIEEAASNQPGGEWSNDQRSIAPRKSRFPTGRGHYKPTGNPSRGWDISFPGSPKTVLKDLRRMQPPGDKIASAQQSQPTQP